MEPQVNMRLTTPEEEYGWTDRMWCSPGAGSSLRVLRVVEGASEVQKLVIARSLGL